MDEIKMREMTPGRIFITAWKIYKENFKSMLFVVLLIFFPISLITSLVTIYSTSIQASLDLTGIMQSETLLSKFIQSPEYQQLFINSFLTLVIQIFVTPLGVMAVAKIANDYVLGGKPRYKDAVLSSYSKGVPLFITCMIYGPIILIGSTFGLVPGIILMVAWYFYPYAIMINNKVGFGALKHSMALVRGRWGKVILMILSFYFLNYLPASIVTSIFYWGMDSYFILVLSRTICAIIDSYFCVAATVFYLNREAFIMPKKKERKTNYEKITSMKNETEHVKENKED